MGEMADFTIDNGLLSDLLDDNQDFDGPAATSCRYCGKDGLYWYQDDHRWRLIEPSDGTGWKIHECRQYWNQKR